jgi:hypothetical protein
MEVKEIESSKGDPSIVLTFQVEHVGDTDVWRFMRTHFGMDAFVVFDSAQAFLLALDDEPKKADDKQQPVLEMPLAGKDAASGERQEAAEDFGS